MKTVALSEHQQEQIVAGLAVGDSARKVAAALGVAHTTVTRALAASPALASRVRQAQRREQRQLADRERKARAALRGMPRMAGDTQLRADATMQPERAGIVGERTARGAAQSSDTRPGGWDSKPSAGSRGSRRRRSGGRVLPLRNYAAPELSDWLGTRKDLTTSAVAAIQLESDGLIYGISADGRDRGWVRELPDGWAPA